MAEFHGVDRPVKTQQTFAEDLSSYYPLNHFDLVNCRNALDHSLDPVRGIEEMFLVAKDNGRVLLEHSESEAVRNEYQGFHHMELSGHARSLRDMERQRPELARDFVTMPALR